MNRPAIIIKTFWQEVINADASEILDPEYLYLEG